MRLHEVLEGAGEGTKIRRGHNVPITVCGNGFYFSRPFGAKNRISLLVEDVLATDWERVKREAAQDAPIAFDPAGEPYDPNDPQAVAAFWDAATVKRGRGRPVVAVKRPTLNMRVDADVLDAFKATGPGWQTRINALLRDAVKRGLAKP